jgi:hypothetical protein
MLTIMEKFINKKISGSKFVDNYFKLSDELIKPRINIFSKEEERILAELFSDCDCLNYPEPKISLAEEQLREIVNKKYMKLKELQD